MQRHLWTIVLAGALGVGLTFTLFVATTHLSRAQGQPPQNTEQLHSPLGTAFTYQGQLNKNGAPITDNCSMAFRLYDQATAGNLIGSPITTTVLIANGLFARQLDFGVSAFTGEARWLGIQVNCPGDTDYTDLGRQLLTPTPYALALPGLRTEQNATSPNIIGGHISNTIVTGRYGGTISGGGTAGKPNQVNGSYGTVGGGMQNIAGTYATVGGGVQNSASGSSTSVGGGIGNYATAGQATVGGGSSNVASGPYATVGGGGSNSASGQDATIPGGDSNTARGSYSFAAGRQAKANHTGSFVWADSTAADFASTGANEFDVRATGGVNLTVGSATARVNTAPLLPRALAPAANTFTTLDSAGDVGQYTSVTIGTDGLPLISYYDGTSRDLKVAHCADVACTSATLTTLDSAGDVGQYTSATIGTDGLPLISYHDGTNRDLKVAHCADAACTSATLTTLDSAGDVGEFTSVTIEADGLGLISYSDFTNGAVKVARCTNAACTSATTATLDSALGLYTSATIGADGLGLISYYDTANGDLKVARCHAAACGSPTITTLDSAGDVGQYTSVTIGADGLGLISYYDYSPDGDLKVAHCNDKDCTSATLTTLVSVGDVGEFTSVTIGTDGLGLISCAPGMVAHCSDVACTSATHLGIGPVGWHTSVTIGADGLPLVSYYGSANGDLKVTHCTSAFCMPYFRRR